MSPVSIEKSHRRSYIGPVIVFRHRTIIRGGGEGGREKQNETKRKNGTRRTVYATRGCQFVKTARHSPNTNNFKTRDDVATMTFCESSDEKASPAKLTPYRKAIDNLDNDRKWQTDTAVGKRIGLYKLSGELGKGNFSQVKTGYHELTKGGVFIKSKKLGQFPSTSRLPWQQGKITINNTLVRIIFLLFEVIETYTKYYLIMEHAAAGELFKRLISEGRMHESEAKNIFAQIVLAVKHLHDRKIVHRDIKAENVFLSSRGVAKLGDFGFSITVSNDEKLETFCGSPPYAAPELFLDQRYVGRPVDVWSLGVLLFFMTTATMPFIGDNMAGLRRSILAGQVDPPSWMSESLASLIGSMLNTSPDDRFGVDQVLKSDWLREASAYQSRFNNNSVYGHWCAYPTVVQATADGCATAELTDTEANARRLLESLGISKGMLDEHCSRGSRSNVVATYRIVVNRLLQQRRLMGQQHQSMSSSSSTTGAANRKPIKTKSRLCAIT
ncbi:Protein kinase domain,Protein kinase-like domain,Serine/threonine-protein kinase, active site [Cinara cedri]|uniref:Protein kinase domain,Protein kinase-like domain,Serine/threonine-protein kinase, active site n=1 Tax=Cinara cedri TaxID=506608 RepID=A0A5E4NJN1_9HEMI|nr:Protein kinase domain,Protein kinase-like domain,Serine/threonine-protein kinase, active site [Cinara cedri]